MSRCDKMEMDGQGNNVDDGHKNQMQNLDNVGVAAVFPLNCDGDSKKGPDNCDNKVEMGEGVSVKNVSGEMGVSKQFEDTACAGFSNTIGVDGKCSGDSNRADDNVNLMAASTSTNYFESLPAVMDKGNNAFSEMAANMDSIMKKIQNNIARSENEINESDIQSTCSTGNLNESRESVFYSDQSSESNVNTQAVVKNVDNNSLCNLLIYTSDDTESDSSSEGEIEDYESPFEERPPQTPTTKEKQGSKTDKKNVNLGQALRAFSDMNLEDLPPVPDPRNIKVDVQEKDCTKMGTIASVIDEIVMVESLPNMPAYDMDTLLFLDKGKQPLGYVYDIIGPVSQPLYAIRFNTIQEIQTLNITKGLPVYSAPKTEHTQYVFLKELMKVKGSDASWKNDVEIPPEYQDYSDDEQEKVSAVGEKTTKRPLVNCNKKRNSLERHQNFEKDMNVRNLIDTRLHKIRDTYEPANKKYASTNQQLVPPNFNKRGFPFQHGFRPAFAFTSQQNTSVTPVPSFAQIPQVFAMPTPPFNRAALPMPSFTNIAPNVPAFVPHMPPPMIPPQFRPNIPPPNMARGPMGPPDNIPPPAMFQNFPTQPNPTVEVNKGDIRQNTPVCVFPANLGLPRPPQPMLVTSHSNNIPPNMTFYRPPQMQQGWYSYPGPMVPPPTTHSRSYHNNGRLYFSHKRQ